MEVKLTALLGNYDRSTNRPTNQPSNQPTNQTRDGHQGSKESYTSNNVPIKEVGNKYPASVFTNSRK